MPELPSELYVGKDGVRYGPLPEQEVRERVRRGEFARSDIGWREGMKDWVPLATLLPEDVILQAAAPELSGSSVGADPASFSYATFARRAGATLIDFCLLFFIHFFVLALDGGIGEWFNLSSNSVALFVLISNLGLEWAYHANLEASRLQGSVGKHLLGIKVTDLEGRPLTLVHASKRFAGKILCGLSFGLGYLMPLFNPQRQGLHDLTAKTLVLNR